MKNSVYITLPCSKRSMYILSSKGQHFPSCRVGFWPTTEDREPRSRASVQLKLPGNLLPRAGSPCREARDERPQLEGKARKNGVQAERIHKKSILCHIFDPASQCMSQVTLWAPQPLGVILRGLWSHNWRREITTPLQGPCSAHRRLGFNGGDWSWEGGTRQSLSLNGGHSLNTSLNRYKVQGMKAHYCPNEIQVALGLTTSLVPENCVVSQNVKTLTDFFP